VKVECVGVVSVGGVCRSGCGAVLYVGGVSMRMGCGRYDK